MFKTKVILINIYVIIFIILSLGKLKFLQIINFFSQICPILLNLLLFPYKIRSLVVAFTVSSTFSDDSRQIPDAMIGLTINKNNM